MFAVTRNQDAPIAQEFLTQSTAGRKLLIIKADFNTPNARDVMKMSAMCANLATMVNQVGAENAVVLCACASRSKEENKMTDPLDYCMPLLSWKSCWSLFFPWVFVWRREGKRVGSKHRTLRTFFSPSQSERFP